MRSSRALILVFACLLAALAAQGSVDALLTVLPLVGLVVLLVNGRYVGEERILRRHARPVPARRRAVATPRPPRPARVRSVFARAVLSRRGPPVFRLT